MGHLVAVCQIKEFRDEKLLAERTARDNMTLRWNNKDIWWSPQIDKLRILAQVSMLFYEWGLHLMSKIPIQGDDQQRNRSAEKSYKGPTRFSIDRFALHSTNWRNGPLQTRNGAGLLDEFQPGFERKVKASKHIAHHASTCFSHAFEAITYHNKYVFVNILSDCHTIRRTIIQIEDVIRM